MHVSEVQKAGRRVKVVKSIRRSTELEGSRSTNATRDDQPSHIRLQTQVPKALATAWVSMCPAQVYEIDEDARASANM